MSPIGLTSHCVTTKNIVINEAASGYRTFKDDKDECIKIVMKPELN